MAVCEAMMIGMPVVALATTEMPTVLEDGRSGIVHTDPDHLIEGAAELIRDHALAARDGEAGRATPASASRSSGSAPTGTAPSGSDRSVQAVATSSGVTGAWR